MTKEECIGLLKRYAEYDGMGIPNLAGCKEAMRMAAELLERPSIPSDLDEVTMDFARELDFFLYGSYTPERFPNSIQVRDEHSGLTVNDWKCWVNKPELKIEMVKHFFSLGKQAGAEWMAGQGVSIDGKVIMDFSNPADIINRRLIAKLGDSLLEIEPGDVVVQIRKK